MLFKEILLPVDLSESARAALHHAAGLARLYGSTITLFHVDEISTYGFHGSEALSEYVGRVEVARTKWLEQAETFLDRHQVQHRVITTLGTANKEIAQHAEANEVDLVIMGRHGEGGARRFLMGSTTKRVLRRAQFPVMIVPWRESDAMPVGPVAYRRILTTTDFSTDSDRGLAVTLQMAERMDAQVTLFHVADVPPVASVPGEPPYWLPNETIEALKSECEARLAEVVGRVGSPRLDFTAMVSTSVAGSIVEAAETLNIDLVTLPTHGKGLLHAVFVGSTTTRVLRLCTRPLLVFPRAWLERTV